LVPVGGKVASFRGHGSLGDAIEDLLSNRDALSALLEVRASPSEIYTNSYFRASIEYKEDGHIKTAHYVGDTACSLLGPGAEKRFDHRALTSSMIVETVFFRRFFMRIAEDYEADKIFRRLRAPDPLDPPIEDAEEDATREARARHLGLTATSSFLNLGVEGEVEWPSRETVVEFNGQKLILLPSTADSSASIHIDLSRARMEVEEARTLLDRFLSLLAWCDDRAAILKDGWVGNPVPVAVPREGPPMPSTAWWIFSRRLPPDPRTQKALALYRQGRTAESSFLVSYAVLSYYKVVELNEPVGREGARKWLRENYPILREAEQHDRELAEFEAICDGRPPHDYLYDFCRSAVAHAIGKKNSSDPDEFGELRRLHVAAVVLRLLARKFIGETLGVSDSRYDESVSSSDSPVYPA